VYHIKKEPIRMCVGCRERRIKSKFLRVSKVAEDKKNKKNCSVFIDKTGKSIGRGFYICKDLICLKKLQKSRYFQKVFSLNAVLKIYSELKEEM
jgi:predicted RNA-binding protein YlxR (DUF448 family)